MIVLTVSILISLASNHAFEIPQASKVPTVGVSRYGDYAKTVFVEGDQQ